MKANAGRQELSGTECLTYLQPPASSLRPPRPRRGFTLVEMLVVIVIIGILVALVTLAVARAMRTGNQARVLVEINQLKSAVENYKQKHGSYPPNPGTEPASGASHEDGKETVAERQQRIERHIRRAFPRFAGTYTDAGNAIANATKFTSVPAGYSSRFTNNGLQLNEMDGAEALVFFLGGLPNPNASTLLTGFAADPRNPFQNSTAQPQRTERFFEFDPTRLVDYDGDGWPEYVPDLTTSFEETAPYAYFDSGSYHMGPHYPWAVSFPAMGPPVHLPIQGKLAGYWGYAVPYGKTFTLQPMGDINDPTTWDVTAWQAPETFQIICAGLDGQYGGTETPLGPAHEDWKRIFPAGEGYKTNIKPAVLTAGYLDLDSDNLTSFSEKAIGDVEP